MNAQGNAKRKTERVTHTCHKWFGVQIIRNSGVKKTKTMQKQLLGGAMAVIRVCQNQQVVLNRVQQPMDSKNRPLV